MTPRFDRGCHPQRREMQRVRRMRVSRRGERHMVCAALSTVGHVTEMTTRKKNMWVRHSDLSSVNYNLNAKQKAIKVIELTEIIS